MNFQNSAFLLKFSKHQCLSRVMCTLLLALKLYWSLSLNLWSIHGSQFFSSNLETFIGVLGLNKNFLFSSYPLMVGVLILMMFRRRADHFKCFLQVAMCFVRKLKKVLTIYLSTALFHLRDRLNVPFDTISFILIWNGWNGFDHFKCMK